MEEKEKPKPDPKFSPEPLQSAISSCLTLPKERQIVREALEETKEIARALEDG